MSSTTTSVRAPGALTTDATLQGIVPPLHPEEREALRADIEARGVLVPIEVDEAGVVLDGHNRLEIAAALGKPYKTITRHFKDETERVEHVIKLNLCRRHLDPLRWGQLFKTLLEVRGVKRGRGGDRKSSESTATLAVDIAKTLGVSARTARHRVALAEKYNHLPEAEKKAVDNGEEKVEKAHKKVQAAEREKDKAAQVTRLPERPLVYRADAFDWMEKQPPCDLLLTDPPYSTDVEDIATFAPRVVSLLTHVKPTGRAYICIGAYPHELTAYLNAPVPAPMALAQVLVWTYRNTLGPAPKRGYKLNWQAILYYVGDESPDLNCPDLNELFSVQDINAPDARTGTRDHAWQKPGELAERFIRHATKPGDLLLDPFAGTGVFLMAATRLGRKAVGCDLDQKMISLAVKNGCRHG